MHILDAEENCCTSHHESHKTNTFTTSYNHNKSNKQNFTANENCCKYKILIYKISKPFIFEKHFALNHIIPLIAVLITNESQENRTIFSSFFDPVIHFTQTLKYLSFINVWIL